jgi:hypothetical protein
MKTKTCLITGANSGIGKQAALATSPDLDKTTGKYFNEKNMTVNSSPYSMDKKNIDAVMKMSMKYLEL